MSLQGRLRPYNGAEGLTRALQGPRRPYKGLKALQGRRRPYKGLTRALKALQGPYNLKRPQKAFQACTKMAQEMALDRGITLNSDKIGLPSLHEDGPRSRDYVK